MKSILIFILLFSITVFAQEKEDDWDFVIDSTESVKKDVKAQDVEPILKKKKDVRAQDVEPILEKKKDVRAQDVEPILKGKKDDSAMDFTGINMESDSLDDDLEKEEEEEIDKEISKSEKNVKTIDLKEKKKIKDKEKEKYRSYLSFFKLQTQMDYQNLMLFENIPYKHLVGLEVTTSIMGLELDDFNAYVGEIGYRLFYGNSTVNAVIISPLKASFNLKKWGHIFPFKVDLFKIYFFDKTIVGNSGEKINLFFEYISLSASWQIFRDKSMSSNIFFSLSFGPDDIKSNPKRESVLFTIGISGDFSPIRINF
jgi:hypothetical protein